MVISDVGVRGREISTGHPSAYNAYGWGTRRMVPPTRPHGTRTDGAPGLFGWGRFFRCAGWARGGDAWSFLTWALGGGKFRQATLPHITRTDGAPGEWYLPPVRMERVRMGHPGYLGGDAFSDVPDGLAVG